MRETATPISSGDALRERDRIHVDCIRSFYRARFRNLLAHIPISFIPIYVGWTEQTWRWNLIFIGLLWVYVLGSVWSTNRFNNADLPDEQLTRWRQVLYPQYAFLALVYNLIFLHLQYYGIENSLFYLFLITAGFSAGGVGAFSYIKWLGPTFVLFAIFPQIAFYFLQSNPGSWLLGFAMVIFLLFMSNVCLAMNRDVIKNLRLTYELEEARDKAETMALTDELTGLFNRRAIYELGETMLANGQRYGNPVSIIMLDIDHFKRINDKYGHYIGDKAIKSVADHILKAVRRSDISARIGGEEFCVILPETNAVAAGELAERLRLSIEKSGMEFEGKRIKLTISIGVAEYDEECRSFEQLLRKVDQAMYSAKQAGRNRIVVI